MTKHVLIQGKPPKKKKIGQHPVLPDPTSELPVQYHEKAQEDLDIYGDADTGKVKAGKLSIVDKIFKGIPVKIVENDD